MRIGIVTMCYNEEDILPYFMNHYLPYVDEIRVLYETDTNDMSRNILYHPKVNVKDIHIEGGISDNVKVGMVNAELADMGRDFDWIYVLDPDEFIYPDNHEHPHDFLKRQTADVVYAHMWQVFRHKHDKPLNIFRPPLPQRQHGDPDLYNTTEHQHRDKNSNSIKPSVIRGGVLPNLLPGNHVATANISVSKEKYRGVHWQMADPSFSIKRRLMRKERISKENRMLRHGFQHFDVTESIIQNQFIEYLESPLLPIFDIPNLGFLKYLSVEINDECPLTRVHNKCPRSHNRFMGLPNHGTIDYLIITRWIDLCIEKGFKGLITLHNYNEPMMTKDLVHDLVQRYPNMISLWTSGILFQPSHWKDKEIIEKCHDVMVTRYDGVSIPDLSMFPNVRFQDYELDNRTGSVGYKFLEHCNRPDWEIILNYRGYINMCCGDWKGEIQIGNAIIEDHHTLLHRWNQKRIEINNRRFPQACKKCLGRGTSIPLVG